MWSQDAAPPGSPWRFALGVVLVAVLAGLFAVVFRLTLYLVFLRWSGAGDVVTALSRSPFDVRLLLPALGGLAAGIIGIFIARAPAGHGVGDVMEAVVLGRVRLAMPVTLLKSLASWCAIASGGSIGREGPLIQFGGAAGKLVADRLELPSNQVRILIAAGTAAGFAAAYNTPFAAVLFVLEVVAGIVVLDTMVPAVIATVIATAIARSIVGEGPIYGSRAFAAPLAAELFSYLALGVLAGLAAQAFMRLLSAGERLFRASRLPLPWRPAIGGLLAGAIIAYLPEAAGNGYEPLNELLNARYPVGFIALLLVAKAFATTASVSSGSPGGVFTPSLLIGGGVGFIYAELLRQTFGPGIGPPGGYALVGMAAATAATTHAPLMAAVMAFELSGDYAIVLPLLLATAVATAVSRHLRRDSIYGAELRHRGVAWELTLEGRKLSE